VGAQRGLGRVRGGILGGGGVGGLAGRVAGDRGVVAERAWGVNAACVQKKQLGTDPLCRHIPTTVLRSIADTALSSGSHVGLMTLPNPVESLFALPYLPPAAPIVFSKKRHHCTSLTMMCVLPDQLRKGKELPGKLGSCVPSRAQSCPRLRCVEHFWAKHE